MVRYFVAYCSGGVYGNCEITRTRREGGIRTMADVKSIEKIISEDVGVKVTVMAWRRWRRWN